MSKIIMTADELARRHLDAAEGFKTIYMYACYGFQVTDATIRLKAQQNLNGWYTPANIAKLKAVANEEPPVWGFDCVNLTKGILWGWTGDASQLYGGAHYGANGVPDTNANGMIERCRELSTDFSTIEIGEGLWLKGHWGLYVGNGLAVECTNHSGWKDGVQITAVWNIGKRDGYHGRFWTKHGKLPWIQYSGQADTVEPEVIALGSRTIRKGTQGTDVRELQEDLMKLGYQLPKFGADGDCGDETVRAIEAFQTDQGIEVDGVFGRASYEALQDALRRSERPVEAPANPMDKRYTITLRGVPQAEMDAMLKRWPDAEVTEE